MSARYDHFTVDEDGDLYFVDRSDDIIKTRGEKVSSVEVENALHDVAGGPPGGRRRRPRRAARGGRASLRRCSTKGLELTELDVIRECRTRLENFMVPREVVFLTELPHTDSGKVRKKSLSREPLASSPASTLSRR